MSRHGPRRISPHGKPISPKPLVGVKSGNPTGPVLSTQGEEGAQAAVRPEQQDIPRPCHLWIAVPVPEPQKTLFIAMPFDKTFDPLSDVIVKAALGASLTPYRSDFTVGKRNFMEDILHHILSSRVVLAVCSSKEESGFANPNVMYELGLAQSMGKATILLTNDARLLPSNVWGQTPLQYQSDPFDRDDLQKKLENLLLKTCRQLDGDIIDRASYPHITVLRKQHWMQLHPHLCQHLRTVLNFSGHVNRHFELVCAHLEPLLHQVVHALSPASDPKEAVQRYEVYQKGWDIYVSEVQHPRMDVEKLFLNRCPCVDEAYAMFKDARVNVEAVESSRKFFLTIEKGVRAWIEGHCKTHAVVSQQAPLDWLNQAPSTIFPHLCSLHKESKTLATQANQMTANIMEIVLEGED